MTGWADTAWLATCWSWGRSLLLSFMAVLISQRFARQGRSLTVRSWVSFWGVLFVPFLTPGLMLGYAYGRGVLALREWQGVNEILYDVLLLFRLVPLGTLLLTLVPNPPLSAVGLHCLRLLTGPQVSPYQRWQMLVDGWRRGPVRQSLLTWGVLFLWSYQDFELASLMGVSAWSVWLFDAQAGGLPLSESLRKVLLPLGGELLVLAPLLGFISWERSDGTEPADHRRNTSRSRGWSTAYLMVGMLLTVVIPAGMIGGEALQGVVVLWRNPFALQGTLREIGIGLLHSFIAAVVTQTLCTWMVPRGGRDGLSTRILLIVVGLSGLCGPLTVSLLVLSLFQSSVFNPVYNTGIPWLCGLVLVFLPYALGFRLLMWEFHSRVPVFLANLLRTEGDARQTRQGLALVWRMQGAAMFWSLAPVVYLGYFDLTTGSLLAPTGGMSAPVRLYNLMHYGHNATLSSLAVLTMAAPVLLLGVVSGAGLLLQRGFVLRGEVA